MSGRSSSVHMMIDIVLILNRNNPTCKKKVSRDTIVLYIYIDNYLPVVSLKIGMQLAEGSEEHMN